jgi:aminopeptidase N
MKPLIIILCLFTLNLPVSAQRDAPDTTWKNEYRGSATRVNDLQNVKLAVNFDYDKAYMNGKAWITLTPHFYPTDSLTLDAKGMDIKTVALVKGSSNQPLKYEYNGLQLFIKLDKSYSRKEKYIVYIDYVSKPNEFKAVGSEAITDAKGLYFINPKGEEKDKPTQIWTQGETESNSVWCPLIDKPNQKTTEEIAMTVPSKYVTLSNGKMVSQKKNSDGTRTDTWKMELPHAPYLFFMGVGDFAIVKDQYKGKEVSYYVEKEYGPVARKIFGNTPEMIRFYEKILGIEYPWNKYAQIVGRDYVSGAMENTTATLHQESAQQDARELVDGNVWESTIAHELFHQWFGDLVTSESWSNLTVNESFANYSEYLWNEYKYGKDAAFEQHFNDMNGYLQSRSEKKNLVRYYYTDKEAMFDAVSYNKGGRVLNMLRNYVGDSAFFNSLHVYLTKNKFQTGEAHQLRLAFEEVTGKDMNWFWNQWYFGAGHPKLTINYVYNDSAKNVKVIVKQTQDEKVFRLPIAVDVYNGSNKVRYNVWLNNRTDTLTFNYTTKPDLVNVDGDKMLLAEKTDNKTLDNYIHQYKYASNYIDRREAIDFASMSQEPKAFELLKTAANDKYFGLRAYTLNKFDFREEAVRTTMETVLAALAAKDPKPIVRASALSILAGYADDKYKDLFMKNVHDSSYSVSGAALEGLMIVDSSAAIRIAKELGRTKMKGKLLESVTQVLMMSGTDEDFDVLSQTFDDMPASQAKLNLVHPFSMMLIKLHDTEKLKKGVDLIIGFRDSLNPEFGLNTYINNLLNNVVVKKSANSKSAETKDQVEYIKGKIAGK